jgi:hypothetical protein
MQFDCNTVCSLACLCFDASWAPICCNSVLQLQAWPCQVNRPGCSIFLCSFHASLTGVSQLTRMFQEALLASIWHASKRAARTLARNFAQMHAASSILSTHAAGFEL